MAKRMTEDRAVALLKTWERKLKLAQTKVAAYKKTVKRYERIRKDIEVLDKRIQLIASDTPQESGKGGPEMG